MEKKKLRFPVIVEGKYDKIRLLSLFDARVFTTDGFSVFNNTEKAAFFKRLAEKTKVILFTDSDSAGGVIRRFFRSSVGKDALIELYAPQIHGKEKRKKAPSAEGFLGVEGLENDLLIHIFEPFFEDAESAGSASPPLTRLDLYEAGLEGGENSREKRKALCRAFDLPANLSVSAMLDALNLLYGGDELREALARFAQ